MWQGRLNLKINFTGCALCNSTWGNYHAILEDAELFFCCEVCFNIYKAIIDKIKQNFDINKIDYLEIEGNPRERTFLAISNAIEYKGKMNFLNGKLLNFTRIK